MTTLTEEQALALCEDCRFFYPGFFGNYRDCLRFAPWKASVTCDDMRSPNGKCGPTAQAFEPTDKEPGRP